MPTEYKEGQSAKKIDIERLIEASVSNMISELSHDCQVHKKYDKNECKKDYLFETNLSDVKTSQSK